MKAVQSAVNAVILFVVDFSLKKVGELAKDRLGLVHVYTGLGKGKTSASMGLVLRAIGQGLKVYIIQFLKGGAYTGELISAKNFLEN